MDIFKPPQSEVKPEYKPDLMELGPTLTELEPSKTICRCCLSQDRPATDVYRYAAHFQDLAGIHITNSDGLPRWLCLECRMLLEKSVRFKRKMLKANTMLYEYLTRCAPFTIDSTDPELAKYASPQLCSTKTLVLDTLSEGKSGYHSPIQHTKRVQSSDLDVVVIPPRILDDEEICNDEDDDLVKMENGFSDDDDIPLQEYKIDINDDSDLTKFLLDSEKLDFKQESMEDSLDSRKRKKAKKKVKKRKKDDLETESQYQDDSKSSIRKVIEVDPNKIRIVHLNPEEQIKQRQEESARGGTLKLLYKCELCFKGFNFEDKLTNHMKKHSPSRGNFECKLCHMFLPTKYSYEVHMRIHTLRYECVKCGRRTVDKNSMVEHYTTQHDGIMNQYVCHLCGKQSSNSKTHRGHMRNHHNGDNRPECTVCGKTFVTTGSLMEHMQIHEGIKNYECQQCDMRFRTRTQLKYHQLKHTDSKDYYCVECDVRFKTAINLKNHLQKSLKHIDTTSLKYPCSECGKRFLSARSLSHHVRIQHRGERPHACSICGALLASRASLRKHARSHQGHCPPRRYVCHTCGKAFTARYVLVNHLRTHTGEKPFECSDCGRRFAQASAARTHTRLVHLKLRRAKKEPIADKMVPVDKMAPDKMAAESKMAAPTFDSTWRTIQTNDEYYAVKEIS